MKKGFTLSEVMVTMAVIGIVALVAVPNIVVSYHKKVQYTKFLKMYNTLSSVLKLAQADHKSPDKWDYDSSDPSQTLRKYIYPYLKIKKICEEAKASSCVTEYDYYTIGGLREASTANIDANGRVVIFSDGSWLLITLGADLDGHIKSLGFGFDLNGANEPNTLGRDIFTIAYGKLGGKWRFEVEDALTNRECNPSNPNSTGLTCSIRLLQDGKMNY